MSRARGFDRRTDGSLQGRAAHRRVVAALAVSLMAVAWGGCSEDKSYAVVTVRMAEGELTDISQFLVYVRTGATNSILYYPASPNRDPVGYRLTPSESIDFSISFASSFSGLLTVGVEPRNRLDNPLGYGATERQIDPGHRIDLDVKVVLGALAPVGGGTLDAGATPDASVPDGGDAGGDGGAGCTPAGAAGCAAGTTCTVVCPTTPALTAVGVCSRGGTGKDGDTCRSNEDCLPGSQCFIYGCGRVCRKFCTADAECPDGGCDRRVSCGGQPTDFRFCSQSCDPREKAPNTCKGNFRCLLFANERASCDCVEMTRTGNDGDPCLNTAGCKPGLMCVAMGTPQPVCRPICKLTEGDCQAGRRCTELVEPRYVTWGACVPQ
jgi:hypothetical protein